MKLCIENDAELYFALRNSRDLRDAVPRVLDLLEQDPLACAGFFRGDLLRALMDVPTEFWGANSALFRRYQSAVRAGALARRDLPSAERMEFWAATEG
ncbi:MAG: contact-dependent growth inhibition system immunity protein [Gemmatimonadaceae bacterium]